MSAPTLRRSVWSWLYTNNPFYAISTALMIYAIRAAYGNLVIGEINCWIMLGVMAGYTLVLAIIGVTIVRWGKIWEDARSILLLLLLLFLAVSVSADELFVRLTKSSGGAMLLLSGYLFSAIVTELVLYGTRIRLGVRYRVPFHLLMALFYITPWCCAYLSEERMLTELQWALFLFPCAAGVLFLSLLPAIHRGPDYVAKNGTPWKWPWFPWTAFGVIAAAVALRSFVLCLTFSPNWPIWRYQLSGRSIVFDTIWGTYFLLPLGFSLLIVLLEMGKATESRRLLRRIVAAAPVLLLLALPWSSGPAFRSFQNTFVQTVGSPLWICVCGLLGFYTWAWLRRVAGAGVGVVAMLGSLSVIAPQTISAHTMVQPQYWPMFVLGGLLTVQGLRTRSSATLTAAAMAGVTGLWLVLPQTILSDYRMFTSYHVLWLAIVVLGLAYQDRFSTVLRIVGALQVPLSAAVLMTAPQATDLPLVWRIVHIAAMGVLCLIIARYWKSRVFLYAFAGTLAVGLYGGVALGFHQAVRAIGRPAITAFLWSLGALVLGFLISAHKARWLPKRPS